MNKEHEFSYAITDEKMEKLKKILNLCGVRHYILKINDDIELDVVEYKEYQNLQQRIDKAIELLEPYIEIDMCMINGKMLKPALSILKGEDNE